MTVVQVAEALSRNELETLPADRRVSLRLLTLLNDPSAPVDEIMRVLSTDPVLTARLIAVANASLHRRHGPVTSLTPAVRLLGRSFIRTFAATAALELF